ncbi:MAG: glycoside hydrolase family 2, partial [Oscillospiraceae bacterium]|nr:glycoside hydrolase family 2 [Oscillospiraceae bacterium]
MEEKKFAELYTAEGEALEGQPWQSYPRPQLRRDSFVNLNGEWEFALCASGEEPAEYPQTIRVPFPPQSLLSGLKQECPENEYLFYRREFAWQGRKPGRVLLHIGAADQMAAVWLNGIFLGEHAGGYAPFAFDVTRALREENTLVVRVKDEMSRCVLPYGKQTAKRGGMWYTPVSGIWQTVWLEEVPDRYVKELKICTGESWAEIAAVGGPEEGVVTVKTPQGEQQALLRNGKARVELAQPRLWSPEDPYLY